MMDSNNDQPSTSSANTISHSQFYNSPVNQTNIEQATNIVNKPPDKEIVPSVKKLKTFQQKFVEERFILDVTQSSYDDIQKIYPKMIEMPLSEEDAVSDRVQYTPSNYDTISSFYKEVKSPHTMELDVSEILEQAFSRKLANLIGQPASGKSTLARRITQHFCKNENQICIVVKFMNLNFEPRDLKITLQELLFIHSCVELDDNECQSAFKWITENEDKLLIILDGYDQADWSIKEDAPCLKYSEPQPVQDLVTNLYLKKYLPKSHILITSCPHAIKTLPKSLRQTFTVHLLDLSPTNMKKLFYIFAGDQADELWNLLHTKTPQLIDLCCNPLLLQIIIRVCIGPTSNIGRIATMTQLFESVLTLLNSSNNIDILKVFPSIAELAFIVTFNNTVRISEKELKKVGLDVSTVHHLVISRQTGGTRCVFEGKTPLYFIHKTIQEYLTAMYINKYVSKKNLFQKFFKKRNFQQFVESKLFSPQWTMVRRFLFGIAFDLNKDAENQKWKIDLLKKKLLKTMVIFGRRGPADMCGGIREFTDKSFTMEVARYYPAGGSNLYRYYHTLVNICCDVREAADESLTMEVARHFPAEVRLNDIPLSTSDIHAVSLVLKQVKGKIESVCLISSNLNSTGFKFLVDAIKEMEGSIDVFGISFNNLRSEDVDGICIILEKVNLLLTMDKCFDNKTRNADQGERKKIQNKLNSINNTELEVSIDLHNDVNLRKTA